MTSRTVAYALAHRAAAEAIHKIRAAYPTMPVDEAAACLARHALLTVRWQRGNEAAAVRAYQIGDEMVGMDGPR